MSCDLETVTPAGPVFRLARAPNPRAWPDWTQAGQDGTFGNRWDDPLGSYRVLYASATRLDRDGTAIRLTAPRGFTQEVSRLVYECRTEGVEALAGILYQSRLDDGTSN